MRSSKVVAFAMTVALLSAAQGAVALKALQQTPRRVKITVPDSDRPEFTIPVKEEGKPTFAVIPALADRDTDGTQDRPSYIKILPEAGVELVRIKVSVLYGKITKSVNGDPDDQLKTLKEISVCEFRAADGERVIISELKKYGVRPIEVEVIASP